MLYKLSLRYFKFIVVLLFVFSLTPVSVPEAQCEKEFEKMHEHFCWLNLEVFYIIYFISRDFDVDPKLMCSVIHYESYDKRYRPTLKHMLRARSPSGARGLGQVMPFHYRGPVKDLYKSRINLTLSASYLHKCLVEADGDVMEACRMYNAGIHSNRYRYKNWADYVIPIMRKYLKTAGWKWFPTYSQCLELHLARQ